MIIVAMQISAGFPAWFPAPAAGTGTAWPRRAHGRSAGAAGQRRTRDWPAIIIATARRAAMHVRRAVMRW